MSTPSAALDAAKQRHPRGLYTLFFTEMWERFSYYGMRALLVLFMVEAVREGGMGLTDKTATAIYGLYTASVYLTNLPGGWLADRVLGQQRAVWYGGIIIALGHFTLAIPSPASFYIGLVLVSLGTGLLKPNASTIVGDLYPEGGARRDAGFSLYYMGINLGALFGPLICGWLAQKIDWHYGFAAAGVFMVFGLIQYRLQQHHLGEAGLHRQPVSSDPVKQRGVERRVWQITAIAIGVLAVVVLLALAGSLTLNAVVLAHYAGVVILLIGIGFMSWLAIFGGLDSREKKHLGVLAMLFIASALFWAGYEQTGSNFALFAERYTDREMFGWMVPATWFQSFNPVYILILAPLFASGWVWLARRNLNPSIPGKFALGLIFLGAGFLVMFGAAEIVVAGSDVLPFWLASTYLLHTTGELCLSPIGLSATTKLAPRRYGGRMMGMWFVSMSLGELVAGLIAGQFSAKDVSTMPHIYLELALIIIGVGIVFALLARPVQKYLIGDDIR
ncbi:MAG TPA: peptide MFS transporter [Gammaproteobacteria bacterium]|nr:peptide MFS transporter [Gammaproteobacteria bacterium]